MNCSCIEKADEALKKFDTEIDVTFVGLRMIPSLKIPTRWREGIKQKRGKKPKALVITYCPLCGKKVELTTKEEGR